jgi:serine/threonine protein kinase
VHKLSKQKKAETLEKMLSKSDPNLLGLLRQMLNFNPHFRPSASQLLKNSVFDGIRILENQTNDPVGKFKIKIDTSEYGYDYESDTTPAGEKNTLNKILYSIHSESKSFNDK